MRAVLAELGHIHFDRVTKEEIAHVEQHEVDDAADERILTEFEHALDCDRQKHEADHHR